jgi:hypothetical protein
MNERNVEGLCRLYADAFLKVTWDEITSDLQTHMALRDGVRRGCEKMAAAGALVPSALVDAGEAFESNGALRCDEYFLAEAATMDDDRCLGVSVTTLRPLLERIAKGEW